MCSTTNRLRPSALTDTRRCRRRRRHTCAHEAVEQKQHEIDLDAKDCELQELQERYDELNVSTMLSPCTLPDPRPTAPAATATPCTSCADTPTAPYCAYCAGDPCCRTPPAARRPPPAARRPPPAARRPPY